MPLPLLRMRSVARRGRPTKRRCQSSRLSRSVPGGGTPPPVRISIVFRALVCATLAAPSLFVGNRRRSPLHLLCGRPGYGTLPAKSSLAREFSCYVETDGDLAYPSGTVSTSLNNHLLIGTTLSSGLAAVCNLAQVGLDGRELFLPRSLVRPSIAGVGSM